MRSGIAQISGTSDIDISVEEKIVRFKFDSKKTSLQELTVAIQGKDERFQARLALLADPPNPSAELFEKARLALTKVEGVRALSSPGGDGIVLMTFQPDKKTYLPDVLATAKGAGLTLKFPPPKKPPVHEFLCAQRFSLRICAL